MTHRRGFAARAGVVAALAAGLMSGVVPIGAAAESGPIVEIAPTRSPQGYVHVGKTYVGNVGSWSGAGAISYELSWLLCSPYNPGDCRSVASKTTSDPADTLSYTPTEVDNYSEGHLSYQVTAHDSNGEGTWKQAAGPVFPSRTWYRPTGSDFRVSDTRGAVDDDGVATLVGLSGDDSGRFGLFAQRLVVGAPVGGMQLVYESSRPQNDPTRVLAVETDDAERVQVVFLDDQRNLMVTDRDPATGSWAEPTRLAPAGTFHENTFTGYDGETLLAVAGDGRAAVAWAAGADDDDPPEMHVATRGATGWATSSVHVADQPKWIDCGPDYMPVTIGDAYNAQLGIDPDGDVTVLWARSEQTCPGDPYQGYGRLEGTYRRGGEWTPVVLLHRSPGFFGNYEPVAMATTRAGTAAVLTRSWFEGDSSNTRDTLTLLTAQKGATFGTIDPATGAPVTVLRSWAADGDAAGDGQLDLAAGLSVALNDDGDLHVGWSASGGGGSHTVEVASGTLAGVSAAETVASRVSETGSVRSPRLAVTDDGAAALVFAGTVVGDHSTLGYFATRDPRTGWTQPQTMGSWRGDVLDRWLFGTAGDVRYDDSGRLHALRDGSYGSAVPPALIRLAAGTSPPDVRVPDLQRAKLDTPVTIAPYKAEDRDGGQLTYAWDLDMDGEYDDATTPEVTRTFTTVGHHSFELRVTASDGDFDTSVGRIDVTANEPPSIGGINAESYPVLAGQPATFVAYGSDDFDDPADLTYTWAFDDQLDSTQTGDNAVHTFPTTGWHEITVTVTDTDGETTSGSTNVLVEGENPPPSFTLDVTKVGPGSGRVDGEGIACGTDCSDSYDEGTEVTLVADPADDSVFTGWTGCTEEVDGDCVVVMDEDVEVAAGFDEASTQERTLTVDVTGAGFGTVTGPGIDCGSDCTTLIDQGEQVVLTASPGASSKLKGWNGCDNVVDNGRGCAVNIRDDRSVGAIFAPRFGSIDTVVTSTKVNHAKRKATIGFSGSSPSGVDRFECKLDAGSWAGCTSSMVLKKLSRGGHTFLVRTVDRDGITDKTPAEVTFKVKRR